MWMLIQTTPAEGCPPLQYWLCTGMKYVVGRKEGECDILVDNDKSISRGHADVKVLGEYDLKEKGSRPEVYVMDKSTYGTKLNGAAVGKQVGVLVEEGDKVAFGVFSSVFELRWMEVTVCLSKTSQETKVALRRDLVDIGGHITTMLHEATHVITDVIHPTSVTLGALSLGIPIVTKSWATALCSRTTTRAPPPPPSGYIPELAGIWYTTHPEVSSKHFEANLLRPMLYKDVVFVFLDSQAYAASKDVAELCKGLAINAAESDLATSRSRNAFFIRYQDNIIIDSVVNGRRSVRGDVCGRMGFTVFDHSQILGGILDASSAVFRKVRPPSTNLLESQQRSNTANTTQLGFDRSLTKGDIIGSLPASAVDDFSIDLVEDADAEEPKTSLPTPLGVDIDIPLEDADPTKSNIIDLASPPPAEPLIKRSSTGDLVDLSQAQLDDDIELLRLFTDGSRKEKRKRVEERQQPQPPAPVPQPQPPVVKAENIDVKEEPVKEITVPSSVEDGSETCGAESGVATARVSLVRGLKLDKRWPCFADWPQSGKGKAFKKQTVLVPATQRVAMTAYQTAVPDKLHLSQADHEARYDDLINVPEHHGKRRKTARTPKAATAAAINLLPAASKANILRQKPRNAPVVKNILDPFDYPSD